MEDFNWSVLVAVLQFSLSTHLRLKNFGCCAFVLDEKAPSLGRYYDNHFTNCVYFYIDLRVSAIHEWTIIRNGVAVTSTNLAESFTICV